MRRLRRSAADQESIGVFRKSGVRSRILALRQEIENDPGLASVIDNEIPSLPVTNHYHTLTLLLTMCCTLVPFIVLSSDS